nr:protein trichome birefringence-like 43 [Coffea arabica]
MGGEIYANVRPQEIPAFGVLTGFRVSIYNKKSLCFEPAAYAAALGALVLLSLFNHAVKVQGESKRKVGRQETEGCDIFQGSWIRDDSYPGYEYTQCPFIEKAFNCQNNGRTDSEYLKYRWQPKNCNVSRFDGKEFLSRFKGKSIMFVGDSLSLNQWQSLTCMLHSAVPQAPYKLKRIGTLSNFTFPTYGVSIMYSRNALLVDVIRENDRRVLKLNSVASSSKTWEKMDMLIFDTWHWWLHTGRKQPWDIIEYNKVLYQNMDRLHAYEIALNTWASWVESRVDPRRTKIFFQGVSPDHDRFAGLPFDCERWRQPLTNPGVRSKPQVVLEKVLQPLSKRVNLLDIYSLSKLRIDGHPSVYGSGGHRGMDCTHWCLPGIPDTWNQLLFAALT